MSNNEPNLDQQIKLHELHKRDPERAHDQHEGFLAARWRRRCPTVQRHGQGNPWLPKKVAAATVFYLIH